MAKVRIVAGSAKGRRLVAPPGAGTRPSTDRVRSAVFNSLYSLSVIAGARVLDLYAGTGAMGIEALSRGAASAVFVERNEAAVAALRRNLTATRLEDRATVSVADVDRHIDLLEMTAQHFDLAIVDPPYAFAGWSRLLQRLPAGFVVVESDRAVEMGERWHVHRRRRYGSTVVTLASTAQPGPSQPGADP